VRLYAEADGRLRFAGKNREAERLAARLILARRREVNERLHERHMALLGESEDPTRRSRTREIVHTVGRKL
jgi:hypothetical protein